MNTLRKKTLLIALLLTITFTTSLTAQAGLLDDVLHASGLVSDKTGDENAVLMAGALVPANSPVGGLQKTLRTAYTVQVSGYNSEVGQTDDSPFITANGSHVRDGIVASNMFPFGTIIKIPALYGDKIFVVEDRMNKRYQKNVDIWFASHADAVKLGRRTVQIEVIK
jgi:3D (Asp-Asp-Asp) domain-containing protein